MIKKILCMLFGLFAVDVVHAAQIVNVEYIHNLIENKWSVRIPYSAELDNPAVAANMQYLLTSVDIANQMVNGGRISDYGTGEFISYGTGEFATLAAADTIVANTAIENYVQSIDWRFSATATRATVSFDISAAGTFYVNWGDGIIERIVRPVAVNETYSHTYASAGNHTIRFGGRANGYLSSATTSAISFKGQKWLGEIDGCLGCIFSTLTDGTQPRFYTAFWGTNITGIPETLFGGLTGPVAQKMFHQTFSFAKVTDIPQNLFGDLTGTAQGAFFGTFYASPVQNIPVGLFDKFQGAFRANMFELTFASTDIIQIPDRLFAGFTQSIAPAHVFYRTFERCDKLQSIPANLFGTTVPTDLSAGTYSQMFYGCTALTGPSARINGRYLYEIFPDEDEATVGSMYYGATGLTDYEDIPMPWGGPVRYSFSFTNENPDNPVQFTISEPGYYYVQYDDSYTPQYQTVSEGSPVTFTCSKAWGYACDTIRIAGRAKYYTGQRAAIAFQCGTDANISQITGSLGEIFSSKDPATIYPQPRFGRTFMMCNITSIPENLFSGISGAPAESMFSSTFARTQITEIPENLFAGIQGTPAEGMFAGTFSNTPITEIPSGLFAGIQGRPAPLMFDSTFFNCTQLQTIPSRLFAGIDIRNDTATMMFQSTFEHTGITSIPTDLFDPSMTVNASLQDGAFAYMFTGCENLTGESLKIGGKYLYEIWPDATEMQAQGTYYDSVKLTDWPTIPDVWGGLGTGVTFWATTTDSTTSFSFRMHPRGTFYVDWGDGEIEGGVNTAAKEYSHTYKTPGEYTIRMGANPTKYGSLMPLAISFTDNLNLAKIEGSLGKMFPKLSDGTQPIFANTFSGCANLEGPIPADLFSGIDSAPVANMFQDTFSGCTGLTGEIPENLFAGIRGAPAQQMFHDTFSGCSGLTGEIPDGLFAGIDGAPANGMFNGTFGSCTGLTGEIPGNLFAGINGAPAQSMFNVTFYECSGLTGDIPGNLFAGINGAPAAYMFDHTFAGCYGLTGEIPENLFAGINGAPAESMFNRTFNSCRGLTGEIPENLFAGIDVTAPAATDMFNGTFRYCTDLTGDSAKINGQYLYDIWDTGGDSCYTDATGLDDYRYIPTAWGGLGQEKIDYVFSFQPSTTRYKNVYELNIGAAGKFYVDWGDGTQEVIEKATVGEQIYSHRYSNHAYNYTIQMGGKATAYPTDSAAVRFWRTDFSSDSTNSGISAMDGCLGCIFSTLADGTNPRFDYAFYGTNITSVPETLFNGISGQGVPYMFRDTFNYTQHLQTLPDNLFPRLTPNVGMFMATFSGCTSLITIPENLFAGIQGAPADSMFNNTFYNCTALTSIPENLFAGINGAPAANMFSGTFRSSGITSIPENLFAGINGAPAQGMFGITFSGCSGLTGEIPGNLFAGIQGPPAQGMFGETFSGCSGLTGKIPDGLFAGISGAPAESMFGSTFSGCSGLTGEIPENLFAGIDTTAPAALRMFYSTFYGCSRLTGDSAKINGQYLYDIWDTGGDSCYTDATGLDDYRYIPTAWGGLGQKKQFCYTITDGSSNNFDLSAAGTFTIDWGGVTETITRTNVRPQGYSCPSGAECKTVCISGTATDYSTTEAVLSFVDECSDSDMELEAISGSLGAVFPTLANGRQPLFIQTFLGCRIYGGLPDGLFDGIHGAPAADMFNSTFANCGDGLTSIPEDLFSGISGPLASGTFYNTFGYTWTLTGPSARINGQYLYEIWPDATEDEVGYMYEGATGLSDYSSIPSTWK